MKVGNKFFGSVGKLRYLGKIKKIKMAFMKNLGEDLTQQIPTNVWPRVSCLPA
jgi:hypothetical protein